VFVDAGVPPWYIHTVGTNQHVGRDGILDAAEDLFREKGYTSVTLADVARAVGIRKPSLYYHFPDGKEQLFVAVQERMFRRMGDQLAEAIDAAEPDLRQQLSDAAEWFFSRPPLFLLMMIHHDMPALADHNRRSLTEASYGVIMQPSSTRPRRRSTAAKSDRSTRTPWPEGFFHSSRATRSPPGRGSVTI
jgi:AcrR family transcriptional regulator